MKFYLLLAAVAAVKISQQETEAEVPYKQIFEHVDKNGDGEINRRELVRALKDFAKEKNYKPTRKDWRWVRRTARKADADNSRSLDFEEFKHFVDAFIKHYNLDGDKDDDMDDKLRQIFNHVDTSGDGLIDEQELVTALTAYAKSKNYKITPADEQFVEHTADKADKNDDDRLDFDEFKHFVYVFAKHYGIKE